MQPPNDTSCLKIIFCNSIESTSIIYFGLYVYLYVCVSGHNSQPFGLKEIKILGFATGTPGMVLSTKKKKKKKKKKIFFGATIPRWGEKYSILT